MKLSGRNIRISKRGNFKNKEISELHSGYSLAGIHKYLHSNDLQILRQTDCCSISYSRNNFLLIIFMQMFTIVYNNRYI